MLCHSRLTEQRLDLFFGLKGRNSIAQGNALGPVVE
jgi:hypothetical protein